MVEDNVKKKFTIMKSMGLKFLYKFECKEADRVYTQSGGVFLRWNIFRTEQSFKLPVNFLSSPKNAPMILYMPNLVTMFPLIVKLYQG